jgi:uncharacterized membrane protein
MWRSYAELHAALNDLPVALLLAAVAFEVLAAGVKKDGLRVAAFWMLVAGAAGALAALISGLAAERTVEHGVTVHALMERHETLAITATVVFCGLAGWRIWRRRRFGSWERPLFAGIALLGAVLLLYVAHVGGTMVFRYGAGVPTSALEAGLADRRAPHEHAPGSGHDDGHPASAVDSAAPAGQASGEQTHAPGTPPHQH